MPVSCPPPCPLLPAPTPCCTRQLPSTCTYADYVATVPKPCRLAFGGNPAFALLQSSTSVTVDVHRCSGSTPDALPSIGVALGGDATVSKWSLRRDTAAFTNFCSVANHLLDYTGSVWEA